MGRYRSRSRSYSPRRRSRTPPPRGRKRYDDDRYPDTRSHRDRRSPLPSGLLVRNLPLDARPEDLRGPFERYGPVKDVYLPRNYYTGPCQVPHRVVWDMFGGVFKCEPRGFGFVKYRHGEDAAEAKQQLNHTIIGGREIRIVFAEENRKTPQEMRVTSHGSGRNGGGSRRRARSRSPRRRYRSYSRSRSPARDDSRDGRGRDDDYSPKRSRSYSRSVSPGGAKDDRSPPRAKDDRSPRAKDDRSPPRAKDDRRSPRAKDDRRSPRAKENGRSPHDKKDQAPSRSPSPRGNDRSPSRSRSRSY
ncbi:serine/arginine-rich splicing factor 33-like protein, partial [Trifolium pratense]